MPSIKIETEQERIAYSESGDTYWGSLVRDGEGQIWLAYDTEDGLHAMRAPHEDCPAVDANGHPLVFPLCVEFHSLPLPLTITKDGAPTTDPTEDTE